MKILEKIVSTGKNLLVGTAFLSALGGCATTNYDVNQFCGKNPIVDGTLTKGVVNVDDRGIKNTYVRIEKDSAKFERMDYDGDGFFETQVYKEQHQDGSRTVIMCTNDKAFPKDDGKWRLRQFEYGADGKLISEGYQVAEQK